MLRRLLAAMAAGWAVAPRLSPAEAALIGYSSFSHCVWPFSTLPGAAQSPQYPRSTCRLLPAPAASVNPLPEGGLHRDHRAYPLTVPAGQPRPQIAGAARRAPRAPQHSGVGCHTASCTCALRRQPAAAAAAAMPRGVDKAHLPSKVCETCQRPFTWRKVRRRASATRRRAAESVCRSAARCQYSAQSYH